MTPEQKLALIKRNTQEIVGEKELLALLHGKKKPVVYLGTAITGRPHVGYFVWVLKLADFLKSVIDPNFTKSCLDSGKYDARLQSDQSLATSLGIQGTPTFYVNATSFPGAYNYTDMKSAVDSALK